MWILLSLIMIARAAPSARWNEVTGGMAALERALATHRDRLYDVRAGRFAERCEEVRRAMEHAGCALTLTPTQTDLFAKRPRQFEETPDMAFLMNLLSAKWYDRKDAYRRLVLEPPKSGPAKTQTFNAVFALIEAELRSDFVRIFLTLQSGWPADFCKRLLKFAAEGTQGDRMYVVDLIKVTGKEKNEQVRRTFHLERDGDLDAIVESNGARLYGHGFRGAARSN